MDCGGTAAVAQVLAAWPESCEGAFVSLLSMPQHLDLWPLLPRHASESVLAAPFAQVLGSTSSGVRDDDDDGGGGGGGGGGGSGGGGSGGGGSCGGSGGRSGQQRRQNAQTAVAAAAAAKAQALVVVGGGGASPFSRLW